MKKAFSKLAGVMLVIVLILMGCSSNNGNNESSPGNSPGSSGASPSKTNQTPPVELIMLFPGAEDAAKDLDLVEEEINKISVPKINAKINIMLINAGAWMQQTTLMLAGNEQMDLMYTNTTDYGYANLVSKGQLTAMDDLLASDGQGILAALDPIYIDSPRIEGKVYGIPSLKNMASAKGLVMDKEVAEKSGIDYKAIQSMDDLDAVFAKIKADNPDVTPLVANGSGGSIVKLIYAALFDTLGDNLGVIRIDDKERKVLNMYETPEYMDLVKRARGWFSAGYINKDAATTKESSTGMVRAGTAFSYFSNTKPGTEVEHGTLIGKPVVVGSLYPPTYTKAGSLFTIPKNSKYPDKAMQFLNLMYTDADIINLLHYGIEGKHYKHITDKLVGFADGVDASNSGYNLQAGYMLGNQFLADVWEGNDEDVWVQTDEFNKSAIFSPAVGFTYDAEPVKTEVAAVTNVVNQYAVALETGTVDPEKVMPEFIQQMKAAGIDKIVAEKQRQIDAFFKDK